MYTYRRKPAPDATIYHSPIPWPHSSLQSPCPISLQPPKPSLGIAHPLLYYRKASVEVEGGTISRSWASSARDWRHPIVTKAPGWKMVYIRTTKSMGTASKT